MPEPHDLNRLNTWFALRTPGQKTVSCQRFQWFGKRLSRFTHIRFTATRAINRSKQHGKPNDPLDPRQRTPSRSYFVLSGKVRIGLLLGVLSTGFLLYLLSGGVPPPVWVDVWQVLLQGAPTSEHFSQQLIQSALLLIAWLLLLIVALQVIRRRRTYKSSSVQTSTPAQRSLQEVWATPIVQERSDTNSAEESDQHPRKGTSALWQPPTLFPGPLIQKFHLDTSRGDASIHSFRILQQPSAETDQDGIVIRGWSLCHPGIQRAQEPLEDFLLVAGGLRAQVTPQVPFALFILADGNLVASPDDTAATEVSLSRRVAERFGEPLLTALRSSDPLEPQTVLHLLAEGMQQVNSDLHQYNRREQGAEMVTMTAILILGTEAYTANVGDNRAYLYRPKRNRQAIDEGLFQITNDHSSTALPLEQGTITPDDLFKLPKSDHVYRALGQHATLNTVDVFSITLRSGDILMLCSDGLWKVVRETALLHIVERLLQPPISSPALLCPALVQAALEAGGYDHTSIMVVQVLPADKGAVSPERKLLI